MCFPPAIIRLLVVGRHYEKNILTWHPSLCDPVICIQIYQHSFLFMLSETWNSSLQSEDCYANKSCRHIIANHSLKTQVGPGHGVGSHASFLLSNIICIMETLTFYSRLRCSLTQYWENIKHRCIAVTKK